MADQNSFDVVSQVNMQEVKNAVEQATKEIRQRFDFKDSKPSSRSRKRKKSWSWCRMTNTSSTRCWKF